MVALGRPASKRSASDAGRHFQAQLDIRRDGQLLWHERQRINGNDGLLDSPIGLAGQPVFATLLITGELSVELLERCRTIPSPVRGDYPAARPAGRPLPGQRSCCMPAHG